MLAGRNMFSLLITRIRDFRSSLFLFCIVLYVYEWREVNKYLLRESVIKDIRKKLCDKLKVKYKYEFEEYNDEFEADIKILDYDRPPNYGKKPEEIDIRLRMIMAGRGFIFKWVFFVFYYILNIYDEKSIYGEKSDPDNTFAEIDTIFSDIDKVKATYETAWLKLKAREVLPLRFKDVWGDSSLEKELGNYKNGVRKADKLITNTTTATTTATAAATAAAAAAYDAAVRKIIKRWRKKKEKNPQTHLALRDVAKDVKQNLRDREKEKEKEEREEKEEISKYPINIPGDFFFNVETIDVKKMKSLLKKQKTRVDKFCEKRSSDREEMKKKYIAHKGKEVDDLRIILEKDKNEQNDLEEKLKSNKEEIKKKEQEKEELNSKIDDITSKQSKLGFDRNIDYALDELNEENEENFNPDKEYYKIYKKKFEPEVYIAKGKFYKDEESDIVRPIDPFDLFEKGDKDQFLKFIQERKTLGKFKDDKNKIEPRINSLKEDLDNIKKHKNTKQKQIEVLERKIEVLEREISKIMRNAEKS